MKRLLIDIDLYSDSRDKEFGCSYFYHSGNKGLRSLVELATYALICRKCELAACIESCPNEALGRKEEDKILQKYNMRCTSCKSCVNGCPFGTIYPEMMTYLVPRCDFCLDAFDGAKPCPEGRGLEAPLSITLSKPRALARGTSKGDKMMKDEVPACVKGSAEGVLKYGEFEEDKEKNILAVGRNILVKAEHWELNGKR